MNPASPCFDALADDACWLGFNPDEQAMVDGFFVRWQIRAGDRVLEPGCGSGRLTSLLAERVGAGGRVVAFDSSPAFIRHAIARGLPGHVSFQLVPAEHVALEAGTFDHVICFNVFPHLVPQAALTARLASALRPGGGFWIAHTRSRAFVNEIHRRGPACIQDHLIPAPHDLDPLLREAGLDRIEIEEAADWFLARGVKVRDGVPAAAAR